MEIEKILNTWRILLKWLVPGEIDSISFLRNVKTFKAPKWQFCGFKFGSQINTRNVVEIEVYARNTKIYDNILDEDWLNDLDLCYAVADAIKTNIQKIKEKTMPDTNNAQAIDPKEKPQSFSWALQWLKDGHKVSRSGWNGKGQWVAAQFPDEHSKMQLPYLYLHNAQGKLVPWVPSTGDLFGDDWVIVKDEVNLADIPMQVAKEMKNV